MNQLDQKKMALTFGLFLGGLHLAWSLLVALSVAQVVYDFVLWAHMIHLPVVIGPFDLAAAVMLVIMTSLMGCALGWMSAYLWNWTQKREQLIEQIIKQNL